MNFQHLYFSVLQITMIAPCMRTPQDAPWNFKLFTMGHCPQHSLTIKHLPLFKVHTMYLLAGEKLQKLRENNDNCLQQIIYRKLHECNVIWHSDRFSIRCRIQGSDQKE